MIARISDIGCFLLVLADIIIVLAGADIGARYSQAIPYTWDWFSGALGGAAIAAVLSAIIFAPLATLYDIRNSMRKIVEIANAPAPVPRPVRREPRLDRSSA